MKKEKRTLRDLQKFATKENPLRASSINGLIQCRWKMALDFINFFEDTTGEPAHTGTAIGRAIQLWAEGREIQDALDQVAIEAFQNTNPFPDYDEKRTEKIVTAYATDPRNQASIVQHLFMEQEIKLTLQPHEIDDTKKPVVIIGHIDVVRASKNGDLALWDFKAGRLASSAMLNNYIYQLAVYYKAMKPFIGAELGSAMIDKFSLGGIIRLMDYKKKGLKNIGDAQLFYRYNLTDGNIDDILEIISLYVALIRKGEVNIGVGQHCSYCPAGGVNQCLQYFQELKF